MPLLAEDFDVTASDGCQLHVRHRGNEAAPPLLLAHPIGFSGAFWEPVAALLAPDFSLLIPDARGHGKSARGLGETSIEQLADDMLAILNASGISRAMIGGCSLGSATAMRFGAAYGERATGLVLANAPARVALSRERFDNIISAARSGGYAEIARDMVARWLAPGTGTARPAWFSAREAEISQTEGDGFADAFAALRDSDRTDDLTRINVPCLIVTGCHDQAFCPAAAEMLAREMIDGEACVLSDAGHLAPIERPSQFAARVRDFYNRRLGTQPAT